ncbi:hypothetical protein BRAS3843_100010 [Bradyrhizobium sp. STM 3843]|nr:hypothetical protein BRAS3843_100010 [Bradyrhizobium sp. STM 3843]
MFYSGHWRDRRILLAADVGHLLEMEVTRSSSCMSEPGEALEFSQQRRSIVVAWAFYSLVLASVLQYYVSLFFAYLFWSAHRWPGLFAFVSNVLLILSDPYPTRSVLKRCRCCCRYPRFGVDLDVEGY